MGVVIRISTKTGKSRIELAQFSTETLFRTIARKYKLDLEQVKKNLYFGNDKTPYTNEVLKPGTELYLDLETRMPSVVTHQIREEVEETKDEPRVFLSFESFLQRNNWAVWSLPGAQKFPLVRKLRGQPTRIPPYVTLQHQKYRHVDNVSFVNVEEIQNFTQHWRDELFMVKQKVGFCFGYYLEDPHYDDGCRACLEFIYEPPQRNSETAVEIVEDDNFEREFEEVIRIAEALKLEIIGWIFTAPMRTQQVLLPEEVEKVAALQLRFSSTDHYTGYCVSKFVTILVSPGLDGGPEVQCFMVSDQAMAMSRDGLIKFKEHEYSGEEPKLMHIAEPPDEEVLMPKVLCSGKEATEFDPDWLVVPITHGTPKRPKPLLGSRRSFQVENREKKAEPKDIPSFLGYPPDLRDFHFLLYISKMFDLATSISFSNSIYNEESPDSAMIDILRNL